MPRVYVRANPGRVARVSPQGVYIPEDRYIPVQLTPYIDRLAHVHEDIDLRHDNPVAKKPKEDSERQPESNK